MKTKEFYEYFCFGKKFNLLEEKLVMYDNNAGYCKHTERNFRFCYYIKEVDKFVTFKITFPLEYRSFETGKTIDKIPVLRVSNDNICLSPHLILGLLMEIKDYSFSCTIEDDTKERLVEKMEKDLNCYYYNKKTYEFFVSYEELYNL